MQDILQSQRDTGGRDTTGDDESLKFGVIEELRHDHPGNQQPNQHRRVSQKAGNDHLPLLLEISFPIEAVDQLHDEHRAEHDHRGLEEGGDARFNLHERGGDEEADRETKRLVVAPEFHTPAPLQDTPEVHHREVSDGEHQDSKYRTERHGSGNVWIAEAFLNREICAGTALLFRGGEIEAYQAILAAEVDLLVG